MTERAFRAGTASAVKKSLGETWALAPEVSVNRNQDGNPPTTSQPKSPTCDTLRAAKSKVYGFRPTQLNESQIDAEGKEIDAFWKQVHSAGFHGVSCVRSMLQAETIDHFFQFDAASFLYQTDHSPEQVLQTVAALPHTSAEFTDVMGKKGAEFDKRMRDTKATQEQISTAIAEGEPIYGIANHTAFMNSAVATLQPGDFELLRTARRQALFNVSDQNLEEYLAFTQVMIGLINRLDLYKEFRSH